jgi:hypothetical protein
MEIFINHLLNFSLSQHNFSQAANYSNGAFELLYSANMMDLTKNLLLTMHTEKAIINLRRDIENNLNVVSNLLFLLPKLKMAEKLENCGKESVSNKKETLTITEDGSTKDRKISGTFDCYVWNAQIQNLIEQIPEFPRKNIGK